MSPRPDQSVEEAGSRSAVPAKEQEAGFTPGPWKADHAGFMVHSGDGQKLIANVFGWEGLSEDSEGVAEAIATVDADVSLIAASPDLFGVWFDVPTDPHDGIPPMALDMLRCAARTLRLLMENREEGLCALDEDPYSGWELINDIEALHARARSALVKAAPYLAGPSAEPAQDYPQEGPAPDQPYIRGIRAANEILAGEAKGVGNPPEEGPKEGA